LSSRARAVLLGGGLLLSVAALVATRRPPPPQNVLLVVIDTLRADALGVYGSGEPTSPNLDAFAADGLRFESAYSAASWTMPSVSSYLTGTMPSTHGMTSWTAGSLPGELPYLPEVLQGAGLTTVGVMGNANIGEHNGYARGFDLWMEARKEARLQEAGLPLYPAAEDLTDAALDALDRLQAGPFFLYVHFMDPHAPYLLPEGVADPFADPAYSGYLPTQLSEAKAVMGRRYTRVYPYFWSKFQDTPDDRQRLRHLYAANVAYVDAQIGRLLARLDELQLADDTLVVVTSDHGEGLSEHGIQTHEADPYEHQIRVPILARHPSLPKGVVAAPAELVDLPFALSGALGIDWPGAPSPANGVLPAALRREALPEDAAVVTESFLANEARDARSIRRGRHKLLVGPGLQKRFDLVADPGELNDLWVEGGELERELSAAIHARIGDASGGQGLDGVDPEELERLRALGYIH
jgi:arylsulfatase A-like enzyme